MILNKKLYLSMCFLILGCVSSSINYAPVKTFDLEKYLGTWYEMARYDHRFEKGLDKVSANYSLKSDGDISVINKGFLSAENRWKESKGNAYVKGVGHLRVSFFWPFYGDYKVLYVDKNYTQAIVGSSSKDYLWILTRNPNTNIKELVKKSKNIGYDVSKLIYVKH